jgi:hypothetical protein
VQPIFGQTRIKRQAICANCQILLSTNKKKTLYKPTLTKCLNTMVECADYPYLLFSPITEEEMAKPLFKIIEEEINLWWET